MAEVERLRAGGREIVRLSSDQLRIDLVPQQGGTAVSLVRLEDQTELLWSSPWSHHSPAAPPLGGGAENLMFDTLLGGWQSIFPNGGDAAVVEGADWAVDGEARLAWFDWEPAGSSVIMKSRLRRSPFMVTKIISVSADEVTIGETVKNLGEHHVDVMWGSQVFLGPALLDPETTTMDASATLVRPDPRHAAEAGYDDILPWPRCYGPSGMVNLRTLPSHDRRVTHSAYLSDFRSDRVPSAPQVTVTNARRRLGVELSWDSGVWPHLWYHLEAGGVAGYPWYGAGRFLSLTPSSSWPARGIHEARRVSSSSLRIHPGVARTAHLSLRVTPAG